LGHGEAYLKCVQNFVQSTIWSIKYWPDEIWKKSGCIKA